MRPLGFGIFEHSAVINVAHLVCTGAFAPASYRIILALLFNVYRM